MRFTVTVIAVVLLAAAASSCSRDKEVTLSNDEDLRQRAEEIAQHIIIIDGHIDVPYRLREKWDDISELTETGEFDYERARLGGLNAPFMSIYTPAAMEVEGGSKALADTLIDMVYGFARDHPDKFAVTVSPDDVESQVKAGKVALCLGMENGSPIEGDLANVKHFYDRGVRYITLTHSKDNHICDSSYDTTSTNNGLTEFGRDVVAEMNRVGIMVDISHVDDDTFWQVMDLTRAPVIASHSSCRHFLPGFERNISDDMIKRVGENGGVIQINFGSTFITKKARDWGDKVKILRDAYCEENGFEKSSEEAKQFLLDYREIDPFPYADVTDVVDHIDHIVKLVGADHVGFGSDFDGVGDSLPTGIKDVSQYPNLIYEMLKRGYSEDDIEKIAYRNVFRVWRAVESIAAKS